MTKFVLGFLLFASVWDIGRTVVSMIKPDHEEVRR